MSNNREFEYTNRHFLSIKKLVHEHAGISLSDAKEDLVYGRIARRLRALDFKSFDQYIELLSKNPDEEFGNFINAITTNLTSFFRENHHFEFIKQKLIPTWESNALQNKKIRIWSAGCSTGEEPYSIAITLLENLQSIEQMDVRILATDIDTNVVAKAESAVYDYERISALPDKMQKRWFLRGKGKDASKVKLKPEVRNLITFKQLNLMSEWPMRGLFDVIFCRNVVIYFNKDTQKVLIERYANQLSPDGHLFLGHSEALHDVSTRFELLGQSSYRKCA